MRAFASGLGVFMVLLWIMSYFVAIDVGYGRPGNFSHRVASQHYELDCNRGRLSAWHQWAEPSDPADPSPLAALTLNSELMPLSGLEFRTFQASRSDIEQEEILGFAHYRLRWDTPSYAYGTRSRVDAWQCPLVLFVIPACIPLAFEFRRFNRRRKQARSGFPVDQPK
jgi:hypothetical protein